MADDVLFDRQPDNTEEARPGVTEAPGAVAEAPDEAPTAMARFQACRWRRAAENGTPEGCNHRDVLPMTGTHGFDPAAWCSDCGFYKLRRTPKKRDYYSY